MEQLDYTTTRISELFSNEVRAFSIYDCDRSIPSGVDGFKPSQRKVIYGMTKKFNTAEVKVSIASAGIMEVSCYHHGGLDGTIIKMAQGFVGSNNLPFLEGIGQFGSRIGPEAAASRYIFVKLQPYFHQIFRKEDEGILQYLDDDGQEIEPNHYLPVIPTVLVNGADGMGTGFACYILNYNPEDIRRECIAVLKKKKRTPLVPWYPNFAGTISKSEEGQVTFTGSLEIVNPTTIKINELPVGKFTKAYRNVLFKLEESKVIRSYDDDSTEESTSFTVRCPKELTSQPMDVLLAKFKLISRESENVTVWNEAGRIRKFASVDELLEWFVAYRVGKYEERRVMQIGELKIELALAREKIRFIEFYLENSKWFSNTKKVDIEKRLAEMKFENIDALMSIRLYNLTLDQIEKLRQQAAQLEATKLELETTTADAIYLKELKELKFS